ncbi:MAG: hypothetical protein WCO58_01325 [bacterium]
MLVKSIHEPALVGVILFLLGFLFYKIYLKIKNFKINRIAEKICNKLNEGLSVELAIAEVTKDSRAYFYCEIKTSTEYVIHIHIDGLVEDTSHDIYFEKEEYPFGEKKDNDWFFKKPTVTLHKEHYDKITT